MRKQRAPRMKPPALPPARPAAGLALRRAARPAAAPAALPEAAASAAAALELGSSGLGDALLSTHAQQLVAEVAEGLEAPVQLVYLVTLMGFLVVGAYLVVRQVRILAFGALGAARGWRPGLLGGLGRCRCRPLGAHRGAPCRLQPYMRHATECAGLGCAV